MTVLKDVRTLAADAIAAANAFLDGKTPEQTEHLQQRQDRRSCQAVGRDRRRQGQRQGGHDRLRLLARQRLHRPAVIRTRYAAVAGFKLHGLLRTVSGNRDAPVTIPSFTTSYILFQLEFRRRCDDHSNSRDEKHHQDLPWCEGLGQCELSRGADEIHCLVGENGAGKSTLMKVLSGVYPHGTYSGDILFAARSRSSMALPTAKRPASQSSIRNWRSSRK